MIMKYCIKGPIFRRNGAFRFWNIPSEWSGKKAIGGDFGVEFKSLEEGSCGLSLWKTRSPSIMRFWIEDSKHEDQLLS